MDEHMGTPPKIIVGFNKNKAGYMATVIACGWIGAVLEKVTRASGQELYAQKNSKTPKK